MWHKPKRPHRLQNKKLPIYLYLVPSILPVNFLLMESSETIVSKKLFVLSPLKISVTKKNGKVILWRFLKKLTFELVLNLISKHDMTLFAKIHFPNYTLTSLHQAVYLQFKNNSSLDLTKLNGFHWNHDYYYKCNNMQ